MPFVISLCCQNFLKPQPKLIILYNGYFFNYTYAATTCDIHKTVKITIIICLNTLKNILFGFIIGPNFIILLFAESFPLLLILTGVLGGVVVIVAITMVIILCQRKVKKPPPGKTFIYMHRKYASKTTIFLARGSN